MRRLAVVLILCSLVLPVSAAQAWTWPVDGPVLRPFSFDRAHPYAAGQHRGVDLGAATGTKVVAPVDGVVSFAGTVPSGGKTVSIQTPSGYTATLVHLVSIGVTRGIRVTEGAVVGTIGPSGTVELAEPYVHFGVRMTSDEQGYVDPLTLLPAPAAPEPVVSAAVESPAEVQAAPAAGEPAAAAAVAATAAAEPVPSTAVASEAQSAAPAEVAAAPVVASAPPAVAEPLSVETPAAGAAGDPNAAAPTHDGPQSRADAVAAPRAPVLSATQVPTLGLGPRSSADRTPAGAPSTGRGLPWTLAAAVAACAVLSGLAFALRRRVGKLDA